MRSTEKVFEPREITGKDGGNFKSNLAQFYTAFAGCFFVITNGMLSTVPTMVVGALHNKVGESLSLDDTAASWIGSIVLVCHPCGALCSGIISDKVGRKKAMMLLNIPLAISWIFFYSATSVQGLIFATIFLGFALGLCEAPIASYISESIEPRLRGVFNSTICAAYGMGFTIELSLGSYMNWRTSALVGIPLQVVSFLLFLTVPESPVWLITKGRMSDGQKALGWLRGFLEPQYAQKEFEGLVRYSKQSAALSSKKANGFLEEKTLLNGEKKGVEDKTQDNKNKRASSKSWVKERFKELTNPKLYLSLRMVVILLFITQCAGISPIKAYIIETINKFWFPVDSQSVLVMTGFMSSLGGIAAIFLVKLVGKRALCMACMIISTICIFGFGFYSAFFMHSRDVIPAWLFIILLAIIHFLGNLGVQNIPWVLIFEVYPIKGRGIACGISAGSSNVISFLLTKTYFYTEHIVGLDGMLYIYGVISLVGCIYVFCCLPETEGKTLEQIETYFTPDHDRKEKFRMPSRNPSKA